MRGKTILALAVLSAALTGCTGSSSPTARSSTAPSASPTAATSRAISFTATDGVRLSGRLYGAGTTAVVLSNMGDNEPALWDAFAPALADRGYLVMTYSFRYPANVETFTSDMAQHTVDDLRGAIAQLRAAGATTLVLAGGSLGGMATAKVAAVERPAAEVVISSPFDLEEYRFHVTPAELDNAVAKLFIGSTQDTTVPFAQTERMHALAAQPKELKTYEGSEHALHIFEGDHGKELADALIAFITAKAPATS